MPTRTSTTRIILDRRGDRRRRFELTATQVRALETASEAGRISDAIPFASARSMTDKGLLERRGSEWFVTELGKEVRRRVRAKRKSAGHRA